MKISVVVPTYARAQELNRCLQALSQQILPPDEIIVVCRKTDAETLDMIAQWSPKLASLRTVFVQHAGQVVALNAGIEAAKGEILSFTDDDASPWPDWTAKIHVHFTSNSAIGGVGGRDWEYRGGKLETGEKTDVGRLTWFGRAVGNHHLGAGEAREIQFLKGANMSYRRAAIAAHRFDKRLRGRGAQVCNDMAFALLLRRYGWKMRYDPLVCVDHFPAPRLDNDQRNGFDFEAATNRIHNETLVVLEELPRLRWIAFWIWALLIGTKISPGIAILPWAVKAKGGAPGELLRASACGRFGAIKTYLASR